MRLWKRAVLLIAPTAAVAAGVAMTMNVGHADDTSDAELFPQEDHYLLPPPVPLLSDPDRSVENERVAYGRVGDELLEQPILYSHKLHAGRLEIDFLALPAPQASPTSTCMGCHQYAGGRAEQAQADLAKLRAFHEKGEPILVKVHDLPGFVPRKRHVKAGVACEATAKTGRT